MVRTTRMYSRTMAYLIVEREFRWPQHWSCFLRRLPEPGRDGRIRWGNCGYELNNTWNPKEFAVQWKWTCWTEFKLAVYSTLSCIRVWSDVPLCCRDNDKSAERSDGVAGPHICVHVHTQAHSRAGQTQLAWFWNARSKNERTGRTVPGLIHRIWLSLE